MRVLFVSRCAKFDGTSSLSNVPRLVVHRMLQLDRSLYVTWLVPRHVDDEQLWKFLIEPLPEEVRPRLRFVKATGYGFDRMVGYFSTEEIWQQLNQANVDVPYDLIVTQQAPLVHVYKAVLMNRMFSSRYTTTTPWVLWHLWTATLSQMAEVPEYYMGEADVASELTGCYHADLNVWESNYLLQDARKSMLEWFKPAAVKKFTDRSVPVHVGVEIGRLDSIYDRRLARIQKGGRPAMVWGGRFANQKKPRLSFEQMRIVQTQEAASGRIVDAVISTSQKIPDWARNTYPDWQMHEGQDRDGWFDRMTLGDVCLCNSVSEGYGTAWLEMLGAGIPIVFERQWWNEQLVPPWYPFMADTKAEQVEIARALLASWPDGPLWTKYVPMIRDWVKAEQSDLSSGPAMLALLEQQFRNALAADEAIGRGTVGQLALRAFEALYTGDPVPEEAVWAQMAVLSESERQWGKRGDPIARSYLRRALQANGVMDVCQSDQILFAKEGWHG